MRRRDGGAQESEPMLSDSGGLSPACYTQQHQRWWWWRSGEGEGGTGIHTHTAHESHLIPTRRNSQGLGGKVTAGRGRFKSSC